jgi:phosphatidylglycerol:prolipoprotein diacylglycerol transferase
MFPRLSDLINYMLGTDMVLPAKTFGFFLALAFVAAFIPLRADLIRREGLGQYKLRKEKVQTQGPISIREVIIHALIWGIAGYKLGLYISDREFFNNDTEAALMSLKGFWLTGILGALVGGGWKYLEFKKKKNLEVKFENVDAGPSFYLGTVVTIAFVAGILGSKIFAMLEPGSDFWSHPIDDLLSFNGLSFFGGLICAGGLIIYYLYRKGFHILTCVDAFVPGLILAYAVGRIGCQLSGDGDWGILNAAYESLPKGGVALGSLDIFQQTVDANQAYFILNGTEHAFVPKPGFLSFLPDWLFATDFRHNVAMDGIPLEGCKGEYCRHLPVPVFPTPIYETIMGVGIFGILWGIRKRLKYAGLLTGIYMILIGLERFTIEKIRVNSMYDVAGMHFTQAELISSLLLIGGGLIIFYALKQKRALKLA